MWVNTQYKNSTHPQNNHMTFLPAFHCASSLPQCQQGHLAGKLGHPRRMTSWHPGWNGSLTTEQQKSTFKRENSRLPHLPTHPSFFFLKWKRERTSSLWKVTRPSNLWVLFQGKHTTSQRQERWPCVVGRMLKSSYLLTKNTKQSWSWNYRQGS